MNNKTFKKTMATLTISTVLLSSIGISALAAPTTTTKTTKPATTQNGGQNNQGFRRGGRQFDIKPVLDKLVKAKTITAAQETKIIAYQTKQNAARQAQMAKLQNMTQDQRQQYFAKQGQQNGNANGNGKPGQGGGFGGFQRMNQFADLVKNKTITQKQSDAISSAINAARPKFGNRNNNGQNGQGNQGN